MNRSTQNRIEEIKKNGYILDFAKVFNHAFENYEKIALYGGLVIFVFFFLLILVTSGVLISVFGAPALLEMVKPENLKPEESKTYEFAISYAKDNFDFEIVHHRSDLQNLINSYTVSYDRLRRTNYTSYKNIDEASINGTEISAKYHFQNGFGINLGWEILDTQDNTTNDRLTGSAKNTVKMNLSYEINDVALFLNLKRYKDYYGANENRVNENSDYTLADLKVNYSTFAHRKS